LTFRAEALMPCPGDLRSESTDAFVSRRPPPFALGTQTQPLATGFWLVITGLLFALHQERYVRRLMKVESAPSTTDPRDLVDTTNRITPSKPRTAQGAEHE